MRRRQETEFYARQASILLGNNACRSGNDRSPTLKIFFALSRGRRGTQRALNSVSCLLLKWGGGGLDAGAPNSAALTAFTKNAPAWRHTPGLLQKALGPPSRENRIGRAATGKGV